MKLFYVKRMADKDVILKEVEVFDVNDHKIDMFLASHGVNLYWFCEMQVSSKPWDTEERLVKHWHQWHSVKHSWVRIKDELVPGILLMRVLTGAI